MDQLENILGHPNIKWKPTFSDFNIGVCQSNKEYQFALGGMVKRLERSFEEPGFNPISFQMFLSPWVYVGREKKLRLVWSQLEIEKIS